MAKWRRREFLKLGLASATGAGAAALAPGSGRAQLVFPDGFRPSIAAEPSPPVTPFVAPLYRMPVASPLPASELDPAPDPERHQRYAEFAPEKHYVERLQEFP